MNGLLSVIEAAGIPTVGLSAMRFGPDTVACDYLDDEFTADLRFTGIAEHHDGIVTATWRLSALRRLDDWRKSLSTPGDGLVLEHGGVKDDAAVVEEDLVRPGLTKVPDLDDVARRDPAVGLVPHPQAVHPVGLVDVHLTSPISVEALDRTAAAADHSGHSS